MSNFSRSRGRKPRLLRRSWQLASAARVVFALVLIGVVCPRLVSSLSDLGVWVGIALAGLAVGLAAPVALAMPQAIEDAAAYRRRNPPDARPRPRPRRRRRPK